MKGFVPGRKWKWARRLAQATTLVAIAVSPFLGGWQRVDRSWLAAWDARGWDLPATLMERLPVGGPAEGAYRALQFLGGGAAGSYFNVAAVDPVAGAIALARTPRTGAVLVAWAIPILLALVAGRFFCGWLCPFGILARAIRALQARLPWRPKTFEIPSRRPLRWAIVAAAIAGGALGAELLVYAALPHVLVQQAAYGAWLLGGGGAVLGSLAGLVVAGLVFGPTTYCAALCPTGAALSLISRARLVRVGQDTPRDCGTTCHLCDNACWLQLHPSTGDPGPDCDACTRCFSVCPRTNLRVGFARPRVRPAAAALAVALGLLALASPTSAAPPHPYKPRLVLNGTRTVGGVFLAVSIVDYEGVRLDADAPETEHGIELSVFIAQGAPPPPDERGKIASRPTYDGPLVVTLRTAADGTETRVKFDAPNSPTSTPRRKIYRRRLAGSLAPDDDVVVESIAGWTDAPVAWSVPRAPGRIPFVEGAGFALAAGLVAMGLLALALALPGGASRTAASALSRR